MKSTKLFLLLLPTGLGFGLAALMLIGLASLPTFAAPLADPLINEFVFNHTGTDNHEYIEIYGDPLADYHAYTLLQIEGDAGYGRLDSVDEVGITDATGFWVTPFYDDHFENGTLTLLLVQGFSGAVGQDLDLDDDGLLDVFPWTGVVDGVAVTDGYSGDHVYTTPSLDPNFDGVNFTPGGASRLPDGSLQGPSSGWVRNDFDGFGLPGFIGTSQVGEAANTPDSPNLAALPGIALFKQADSLVLPGGLLTYTLNIANHTNLTLTGVVLTDSLPISASFGAVLDGGAWDGSQVRWDIASLAPSQSQTLHWVVNASSQPGFQLTNDLYRVYAANFLTDTVGQPVSTCVLRQLSIAQIQGTGFLSPQRGECVRTMGIVTGHYRGYAPASGSYGGFFLQDAAGDGDPQTSEGLFVTVGSAGMPGLQVGDQVEVWGTVQEFSEYDGAACISVDCQTRLLAAAAHVFVTASGPLLVPEEYAPPGNETANTAYAEAHEGMLVSLPLTDVVVGPTRSGVFHVLPAAESVARVPAGSSQDGAQLGVTTAGSTPNLLVGSLVSGANGPLMNTSYGGYVVRDQDGYQVLESRLPPAEPVGWPNPQLGQFNAATFNTHNFDAGSTAAHTAKVTDTLLRLGGPTVIALQEIDAAGVITGMLDQLQSAGLPYTWAASHPDAGGHGVALLWRTDQVSQAAWSTSYQGCSDVGSPSSTFDPLYADCRATGQYPLFSRRPVVLTATISIAGLEQQIVVIANHFKSQLGEAGSDQRRLEQGEFIHDLVQTFIAAGSSQVLVMGDLNDLESSPALQALTSGGILSNTWFSLPAVQRFSYNYRGRSQVLDHILASPDLSARLVGFNPLHFNSDFPENPYQGQSNNPWFTSDHDPLAASFALADLFLHPLYLPQVTRQD